MSDFVFYEKKILPLHKSLELIASLCTKDYYVRHFYAIKNIYESISNQH